MDKGKWVAAVGAWRAAGGVQCTKVCTRWSVLRTGTDGALREDLSRGWYCRGGEVASALALSPSPDSSTVLYVYSTCTSCTVSIDVQETVGLRNSG